jgi:hypothetical protein
MASGVQVAPPGISPRYEGAAAAGSVPRAPMQVQLTDDAAIYFVRAEGLNINEILKITLLSNLST